MGCGRNSQPPKTPNLHFTFFYQKSAMTILRIELINPEARTLLEDLAKLDLIRIQEVEETPHQFSELLAKLRSYEAEAPTLEEITQEVDEVRHQMQQKNG